ncbi:hypothetical protein JCM10295v2_001780 [Rhodotorula toruloides]
MPSLRLSSLVRLGALFFLTLFILHFLSSFSAPSAPPSPYYDPSLSESEAGWGERLGLDHYADWEEGVRGRVGKGLGRLKDGVGMITGLGGKGAKQEALVKSYVDDANARRQFEDAVALQASLEELRAEIVAVSATLP